MASSTEINTNGIPMVDTPFASGNQFKVLDLDFLKDGVSRAMVMPTANGGTKFSRSHLNGIGYWATIGAFLDRIGYPYGIDKSRAEEIGGYPKGAILVTEDDDYVREYVSLVENNTHPLPQEASDGTYEGDQYWGTTLPKVVDFFPDFSTSTQQATATLIGAGEYNFQAAGDGWFQMSCSYVGMKWPAIAEYDNSLYTALCVATTQGVEVCRLDGRYTTQIAYGTREIGYIASTIPLKQGDNVKFSYSLESEEGYEVRLSIKHWGAFTI